MRNDSSRAAPIDWRPRIVAHLLVFGLDLDDSEVRMRVQLALLIHDAQGRLTG